MRTPFCALLALGLLSANVTAVKIQDGTTTTVDQDVSTTSGTNGGTDKDCDMSKCEPDDKNCCCGGNNVDINIKFNVDVGGKKGSTDDDNDADACGAAGTLCTEETKREYGDYSWVAAASGKPGEGVCSKQFNDITTKTKKSDGE